jgi:ABC-type lipoprotein release transport system permease subunit
MGKVAAIVPLAWRNLWRNPRRSLITFMVIAVGVWSILCFDVLMKAFAASSLEETLHLLTGDGQIHAPGYLDDPGLDHSIAAPAGALLTALGGPGVSAWAERVRVPAIIQSEYRTRAVTLMGVDPASERKMSELPSAMLAGRYLTGSNGVGVVIGADLAKRLKTRLGKRVIVMTQAADGRLAEVGLPIVGLFGNTEPVQDEYVFIGLGEAQATLGLAGKVSEVSFEVAQPAELEGVTAALRRAAPGLDVQDWKTLSPLAYTIDTYSRSYTAIWLAVMFVLMAIGIVNTQLMAVFERTREFGLMQALGMRPGMIVLQVLAESALLIAVGVAAGVVLMVITLAPFAGGLDLGHLAAGAEMAGVGEVLHPKLEIGDVVGFSLIVWALGVATTLWPARAAAGASPVAAMGAAT